LIADPSETPIHDGYFTYDSVPLKWHLPVGLLYDIYVLSSSPSDEATTLPALFKLTLNFQNGSKLNQISAEPAVLHDAFINSVKEADFLRSGTAKPIMSLPAAASKSLWSSVQVHDLPIYRRIYSSLLPSTFRNVPLRIYLPSGPGPDPGSGSAGAAGDSLASFRVLQAHIPPMVPPASLVGAKASGPTVQTLGTALSGLIPSLFPSARTPVLARTLLHGAVVPLTSHLEELARSAAYADGWLGVVVVMNS
jgi:autophagy-related protein 5